MGEPDWLHGQAAPLRWYERLLPARFAAARVGVTRRAAAALALIGLVAVVISGYAVWRDRPVISQAAPVPAVRMAAAAPSSQGPEPARNEVAPTHESQGELVVSVVGLVRRGGLLRLAPGARIADALDAAGGALPGADLQGLNLAQKVSDGDQILVGAADPTAPPRASGTASTGSAAGAPGSGPTARGKVNLNTATEAELDALPGVGPVTARAIVAWRAGNGRFSDLEQLGDVEGIGPARLAKLRDLVTL
ncbi:ComEA family DNA-binding protein [Nocardia jiangsuensis]